MLDLQDLNKELDEMITEEEVKQLGLEEDMDDLEKAIIDKDRADFFIKKIKESQQEIEAIDSACDEKIEFYKNKIDAYRNNRKKEILNDNKYFSYILERYTRTELEGSKKKSIPLTFGTLQLRKTPEKYEYDDKEMLSYLQENKLDDYINIKESKSVDKKKLKEDLTYINDTVYFKGQPLENVSHIESQINFSIK